MKLSWLAATASTALLAIPLAFAQVAPKPTPEQLAKTFEEDQLSAEACGVPRNAADDYRPAPMFPDQTRAPRIATTQPFEVEEVATGLSHAWGLAFLPSGKMLVTIRGEGLKTVSPDGTVSPLLSGVPAIKTSFRLFGMHDVILDRDFPGTRTIYLAYVSQADGDPPNTGYVASARLSADETALTDFRILEKGVMTPRRLAQAADGSLMVITADIITPYTATQSMQSLQGKVLRITTDGRVPRNNPFVGTPDVEPSIWALGLRDAQGLTFHPTTGELWTIENQPRGGDELNRLERGKNYGFPLISYGRDNDGSLLNGGKTTQEGLEQPVHFWTPSVAFSGMAFYTGDAIPEWRGNLFMGGLSGQQLVRVVLKDGRVVAEEKLLRDRCERIRDVRQGPDGLLYLVTDADDGKILRIRPK
ncbi:PQQ-dependent sugar dehydrogenase [bacterium]|nr:PQQ-dependent sugar dehydrogenase [bacterium]